MAVPASMTTIFPSRAEVHRHIKTNEYDIRVTKNLFYDLRAQDSPSLRKLE